MKCAWVRTPQPAVIKNNLAPGDFVILFFSLLFLFYFSPYYFRLSVILFYFSPYYFYFISLPTIYY
jgi:hypothetical protein